MNEFLQGYPTDVLLESQRELNATRVWRVVRIDGSKSNIVYS